MLVAGWRMSLIDAPGATLVVWVCGCNLGCPFCHNWRIATADPEMCSDVDVDTLLNEVGRYRVAVEYLQVSGGEPLLYAEELRELFRGAKGMGLKISLNSNLTLPSHLEVVANVLDHVATDVKVPQLMYGVERWENAFSGFLTSLRILSEMGRDVDLELRIPVARLPTHYYARVLETVGSVIGDRANCRVVLRRIYGRPVVVPRSEEWCRSYCVDEEDYQLRAKEIESLAHRYLTPCFRRTKQ